MKPWEKRATNLLDKTLNGIPAELNELDWKSALSTKTEKLQKHLSAFSHLPDGGFLVYGINDDGSFAKQFEKEEIDDIVKKLGNIARMSFVEPITIDHAIIFYKTVNLLFIYIPESRFKPVYIKGSDVFNCYKRSGGQTVKMSVREVKVMFALSQNISFEQQTAFHNLSEELALELLDIDSYYKLSWQKLPDNKSEILQTFKDEEFIRLNSANSWDITNLGAILFGKDLTRFEGLKRKSVRVIIYSGTSKVEAVKEREGNKGYAAGFEGLLAFINKYLPVIEIIESDFRKQVKMYPEIAIREFVANALIHQDFNIAGTGVTIEIFKDRIEITNPGSPLVDVNRFIDTIPKSRNEILASLLRRLNICEERGSGIDRAVGSIEMLQLPAPKFIREEDYTRVIMYAPKTFAQMGKDDRIRACYQHCVLQYVSNQKTNNESLRVRLNISRKNYPMASRIIADTIEAGFIKSPDGNISKKHATYLPFWA